MFTPQLVSWCWKHNLLTGGNKTYITRIMQEFWISAEPDFGLDKAEDPKNLNLRKNLRRRLTRTGFEFEQNSLADLFPSETHTEVSESVRYHQTTSSIFIITSGQTARLECFYHSSCVQA